MDPPRPARRCHPGRGDRRRGRDRRGRNREGRQERNRALPSPHTSTTVRRMSLSPPVWGAGLTQEPCPPESCPYPGRKGTASVPCIQPVRRSPSQAPNKKVTGHGLLVSTVPPSSSCP